MIICFENCVFEFGVIFVDEIGVFWNCVDIELVFFIIVNVLEYYFKIDFFLVIW